MVGKKLSLSQSCLRTFLRFMVFLFSFGVINDDDHDDGMFYNIEKI